MKKRVAKAKEKVLIFKVNLLDDAAITRELALAEGQTLYTFAEAIIDSFDFALDHCFGFYSSFEKRKSSERAYELFKDVGEEGTPNAKGVKKTLISDAFTLDKKLLFVFDYGDDWKFVVELTGKEDGKSNRKYPFLISKTGESPEQYAQNSRIANLK